MLCQTEAALRQLNTGAQTSPIAGVTWALICLTWPQVRHVWPQASRVWPLAGLGWALAGCTWPGAPRDWPVALHTWPLAHALGQLRGQCVHLLAPLAFCSGLFALQMPTRPPLGAFSVYPRAAGRPASPFNLSGARVCPCASNLQAAYAPRKHLTCLPPALLCAWPDCPRAATLRRKAHRTG